MSAQDHRDYDAQSFDAQSFDERLDRHRTSSEWKRKGLRFLRYLSTRQMECWGFFAAGILIGKILL